MSGSFLRQFEIFDDSFYTKNLRCKFMSNFLFIVIDKLEHVQKMTESLSTDISCIELDSDEVNTKYILLHFTMLIQYVKVICWVLFEIVAIKYQERNTRDNNKIPKKKATKVYVQVNEFVMEINRASSTDKLPIEFQAIDQSQTR